MTTLTLPDIRKVRFLTAHEDNLQNSRLTDEANSRLQTRQSDSVTSLPPAKQNGSLVTGNDLNNNNGSKKEVRVTQGQTGYFRNKKISSPPMRKNEEINTRVAKTKDNKSFSNSYLKAKSENPSNYAVNGSKSESSVKQDKTKNENKNTTSVEPNTKNSVTVNSSLPNSVNNTKSTEESKVEPKNTTNNQQTTKAKVENSSRKSSINGVDSQQRKQSKENLQMNVEKSSKTVLNDNASSSKTGNKDTHGSNGSTTKVKETQNKEEKQSKTSESEKQSNKDEFHYYAQSKSSPERDKVSRNKDKDNSETEDTSVPPLDLSQKPKTKNGRFKFVINKNTSYHYRRKRWSSKSDPTGNATPGKEKSTLYKERPKSILANQQEVRPITKNTPRTFRMDEKEKSIYRNTTFLWDEDTSEAYHTPAVNRPKGITKTYTGAPSHREALKSARGRPKSSKTPFVFQKRSKIPPWYEKAKVLSRQQVNIFQNIKSVYGDENTNKKRESQFLEKVQKVQLEQSRLEYEELMEKERQRKQAKRSQARQLKELRKRFEDEAWHRFQTQYVTSRILEHEKLNRYEYGLPEEPAGQPEYASKLKRKKKVPDEPISSEKLKKVNQKKYGKMFGLKMGPEIRPKTPLMEGIDTVVLTQTDEKERNTKEKKKMVKTVITEAKDQIKKVPQKGTGLTPREESNTQKEISRKTPSLNLDDDDDDDDMSDIFEHARKKYHLDIDEDD